MASPPLVAEHCHRPGHDNDNSHYNVETHYGEEDWIHRGNRNTEHDGGVVRHMIASSRARARMSRLKLSLGRRQSLTATDLLAPCAGSTLAGITGRGSPRAI